MHSLVTPGPIEAIRVPPEDDMAEGQRRSSAPERHYPLQEAAGETAVHFENTIDDLDVTFRYDRDHGAQQPEDCNGERPGVREPAYGRASCEPDRALPRADCRDLVVDQAGTLGDTAHHGLSQITPQL
jgi:hypothetical protein